MKNSISLPLLYFVGILAIAITLRFTYQIVTRKISRDRFKKINNCQPVRRYPHKDPLLGLDYWYSLNKAAHSHTLLPWLREQYRLHGNTYYARLQSADVINTCEPENLKAMHSTKFNDFAMDSRRNLAFLPLLGHESILLSNGAAWEHKRAMLRPSFSRDQYTNLPLFEHHFSHFLDIAKAENGRAGQVDLADLFICLTVDITSELMYGRSIGLLVNDDVTFRNAMTDAAEGGHARWLLVFLAKIFWNPGDFACNVRKVRSFMEGFVDEAISYREVSDSKPTFPTTASKKWRGEATKPMSDVNYLQRLALATSDRTALSDELTTILFAGRDTTSALMTSLIFTLAKRPDVWAKIRAEIGILGGRKPTFEELKGFIYLNGCLHETLRLWPIIPLNTRMTVADTVLPRGGGPTGESPIFVAAGTSVAFHVGALHRRKDLWGEDADEFRPERWKKIKNQGAWMYQPWSGGPRNCPGQHLSLAEAGYTTLRMAQEFRAIESRDENEWTELIGMTCTNKHGTKVTLVKA